MLDTIVDSCIGSEQSNTMRPADIIRVLVESGFSKNQAMAIQSVISGIRSGIIDETEASMFLTNADFNTETASALAHVFFENLAPTSH